MDFKIYVLNPIHTSSIRKNNIHKTKADKVNAFVIVKALMIQASPRFLTLEDLNYIELQGLNKFHQKAIKQRTN